MSTGHPPGTDMISRGGRYERARHGGRVGWQDIKAEYPQDNDRTLTGVQCDTDRIPTEYTDMTSERHV